MSSKALTSAAESAARDGKGNLRSKARHYGVGTTLHWRRHKALIDNDGQWYGMDVSKDVSQPVIDRVDGLWVKNFNEMPSAMQSLKVQFAHSIQEFVNSFASKLGQWPDLKDYATSIGTAQAKCIHASLGEQLALLDGSLSDHRGGYAEEVVDIVKAEVTQRLRGAQGYCGTGSFSLRKESVTQNLPCVSLDATADAPRRRMQAISEQLSQTSRAMVADSCAMIKDCYKDIWETQRDRSGRELAAKAQFLAVVSREMPKFAEAFSRVQASMPQ